MRVLLTTPYDLAVPGGVNRHAFDLLESLTRRGVTAKLVGPASASVRPGDSRVVRLGRVWVGAFNGARSRVTLDLAISRAMRRLVAEFQPEVIHLQEPFLPTLNTFALWSAGAARRVGTFHTFAESSRGYLWAWPYCRWVHRRLDARIAVSAAARDFAARFHPGDYRIIPNGVWSPPPSARRPARPPARPARLLFVGRADEPRKGFGVLQAAWARLEAANPGGYVLDAVGRGTPRGEVSEPELSAAYAAADGCVVPSLGGESFGLVALEALAHGVPVIASRIRGYADWLEGAGVGELVAPGDPAALAAALARLLGDPERHRRCAEAALALAARHDWATLAERIVTTIYGGRL
jgi:phosphatidylinositol alpha-mannosyltransferase